MFFQACFKVNLTTKNRQDHSFQHFLNTFFCLKPCQQLSRMKVCYSLGICSVFLLRLVPPSSVSLAFCLISDTHSPFSAQLTVIPTPSWICWSRRPTSMVWLGNRSLFSLLRSKKKHFTHLFLHKYVVLVFMESLFFSVGLVFLKVQHFLRAGGENATFLCTFIVSRAYLKKKPTTQLICNCLLSDASELNWIMVAIFVRQAGTKSCFTS